jgi:hypothetical protein
MLTRLDRQIAIVGRRENVFARRGWPLESPLARQTVDLTGLFVMLLLQTHSHSATQMTARAGVRLQINLSKNKTHLYANHQENSGRSITQSACLCLWTKSSSGDDLQSSLADQYSPYTKTNKSFIFCWVTCILV